MTRAIRPFGSRSHPYARGPQLAPCTVGRVRCSCPLCCIASRQEIGSWHRCWCRRALTIQPSPTSHSNTSHLENRGAREPYYATATSHHDQDHSTARRIDLHVTQAHLAHPPRKAATAGSALSRMETADTVVAKVEQSTTNKCKFPPASCATEKTPSSRVALSKKRVQTTCSTSYTPPQRPRSPENPGHGPCVRVLLDHPTAGDIARSVANAVWSHLLHALRA